MDKPDDNVSLARQNLRFIPERGFWFGTIRSLKRYEEHAQRYFENIECSSSIRLIVLETWLFVDFVIREILMSGLQLDELPDLDLRHELLPRSLPGCVRLLKKLRDVNKPLPPRPEQPFTFRCRKFEHFEEFDPGLLKRMEAAEESYFKKFEIPQPSPILMDNLIRYRSVPDGWLEIVELIDEPWEKRVQRLNDARNLAAHSYEEKGIAAQLGFNGAGILTHVRTECHRLIEDLLGVGMARRTHTSQP